jgi:hypothetical protein
VKTFAEICTTRGVSPDSIFSLYAKAFFVDLDVLVVRNRHNCNQEGDRSMNESSQLNIFYANINHEQSMHFIDSQFFHS